MTRRTRVEAKDQQEGSGGITGGGGWSPLSWGISIAVGLVTMTAFLPILGNGFVDQWDDGVNFLENPHFQGLDWSRLRWAWTTLWQGVYQPLSWMLAEAEYATVGLSPVGFHVGSLILHAINAILVYLLIQTILERMHRDSELGNRWMIPLMSSLAALLFAVNPLRVEAVAWASCQPYLPCAGFAILSVLAYLRAFDDGPRHRGWFILSVGFFAVALGFKAAAIGLPVVLVVLDLVVLKRLPWGTWGFWLEKVPFLILAIGAGYLAVLAKTIPGRMVDPNLVGAPSTFQALAIGGYRLAYYVGKTVWPTGLSAYHYRPMSVEPTEWRFVVSLVAVFVVVSLALIGLRRRPVLLAGLICYTGLIAPNLGLVSYDLMLVADRYAYIATLPLFVLLAGGMVRLLGDCRWPKPAAVGILAIGLGWVVVWSMMSREQCRTWRDSPSLVAQGLKVGSGRDALFVSNYGLDLIDSRRFAAGMAQLRKAITIDPADADARANLGRELLRRGEVAEGVVHLGEAVRLAPGRFGFRYDLGVALARIGRLEDAFEQLSTAVRLRPDGAQPHVALGDVLAALKRRDQAAVEYTEALRLQPDHPGARRGMADLKRD